MSRLLKILSLWVLFVPRIHGQAIPVNPPKIPASFTVKDYVHAVLKISPDVLQIRAVLEQTRAQWKSQLGSAFLPTLSFSAFDYPYGHNPGNNYIFNHWRLNNNDISHNASVNLNLFNSFQDYLKVRSASAAKDSTAQALQMSMQGRALEATQVFHDLHLKQNLLSVAQKNLEAQKAQYDLTLDLYRHGMKSLSDLLKSETDWRSSELRLVTAEADHKTALMQFNLLINQSAWEPAALQSDLEPGATTLPDLSAGLEHAADERPDILKARYDLEKSAVSLEQSLQSNLPSLTANAAWNRQDIASFGLPSANFGIPNPNYQVGINLSLPIGFNLFSQTENYLAARADKKRAGAALDSVSRQIRQDVYSAFISLERSYKTYRIASQKENIANQNLDLVSEQYRQGAADVIRLAQAQLDYLQSQIERAQALRDAFVSRAQYKLAVGETLW